MTFNSLEFALFLPLVLAGHRFAPPRLRNPLLLVASYIFYGWWDARFLGLLGLSTIVDYGIGRALGRADRERVRLRLLITSLGVNLGVLGVFKYLGFFVESAGAALSSLGGTPNWPLLHVALPVGISFYTFQTISYTFDVYRRRIEPRRSLVDFALYVAYFPQLVAGPIERARSLLPQLEARKAPPRWPTLRSGLALIGLGLVKKVAIADAVAPVADAAFGGSDPTWGTLVLGVYAFAIQIYGDFSGYTDIARGTSRLFGVELMRNFEQPYLSRNITEFWRTWHVSLSNWLHDYLYVPLGGNRKGRTRTYVNLLLTMVLGGLWHGAAWTFVAWGGLHGLYLALHRAVGRYVPRGHVGELRLRSVLPILVTFHLVALTWIPFRARSWSEAVQYVGGLLSAPMNSTVPADHLATVVFGAGLLLAVDIAQRTSGHHDVVLQAPRPIRAVAYAAGVLLVIAWSSGATQPFIYFQF